MMRRIYRLRSRICVVLDHLLLLLLLLFVAAARTQHVQDPVPGVVHGKGACPLQRPRRTWRVHPLGSRTAPRYQKAVT